MNQLEISQKIKTAIIISIIVENRKTKIGFVYKKFNDFYKYRFNYDNFKKHYNEAIKLLNTYNEFDYKYAKTDIKEALKSPAVVIKKEVEKSTPKIIKSENSIGDLNGFLDEDFEVPTDEVRTLFENNSESISINNVFENQKEPILKEENYMNDDVEVPLIFNEANTKLEEVVISNQIVPVSIKDIKVRRKKKIEEKIEKVEKVEIVKDEGFVDLPEYNETVWYDIAKFKYHLLEKGYREERDDYKRIYYQNMVMMNILSNKEIEINNPEIIDFKKENGLKECDFGASRINEIKDNYCTFKYLSDEYPDFRESKYLKDKKYFEIIMEWEEGTATRNYLDKFIGKIKKEIFENYDGVSDEQIEVIINNALSKWKRKKEDVRTRSDCFAFIKNTEAVNAFEEENVYMPYDVWFNNDIPLKVEDGIEIFNETDGDIFEIGLILFRTNYKKIKKLLLNFDEDEELKKMWVYDIYKFKLEDFNSSFDEAYKYMLIFIKDKYNHTFKIFVHDYMNYTPYVDLLKLQDDWIFNYNKNILDSKKEAIILEFAEEVEIILEK